METIRFPKKSPVVIPSVDSAIGSGKAILEIFDVALETAGRYSCLASNGVGQDLNTIISITVLGECFMTGVLFDLNTIISITVLGECFMTGVLFDLNTIISITVLGECFMTGVLFDLNKGH